MSRVGKQPIPVPEGVNVEISGAIISVSGTRGNLSFKIHDEIGAAVKDGKIMVSAKSENKFVRALHGLTRSIIANMVQGVTLGHAKTLEIVGTGYRAAKQGESLVLNMGYSHPVIIEPVEGIQIETKENKIIIAGADKALVGETAAKIRRVRPPEPYKGKGIRYQGEFIRRKAGKAAKTGGTA